MGGFADISGIIASLRAATDIAKSLATADSAIEKAELKLQLADIMTKLAHAQTDALEIDLQIIHYHDRIKELEDALRIKATVGKDGDAYYELKDGNKASGSPYCLRCWEIDHKLVHLIIDTGNKRTCPHCNRSYDSRRARDHDET